MKERFILGASFAALFLSACGGGGNSSGGSGSFTLGVTDAPVDDADAVVVTFSGVELLGGPQNLTFEFDPTEQVDLLSQQGDQQFFLVQNEAIPAGVYEEVRLIVDQGPSANCIPAQSDPDYPNYVTVDGVDYPLIVPSGAQTGLKVKGPITVAAGGTASYTVDFDLRKSLAERGVTGCYNLRPVLRVVDNAETGTLTGTVDPALFSAPALEGQICSSDATPGVGTAVYVFQGDVTPDEIGSSFVIPGGSGVSPMLGAEPLTTAMLSASVAEGQDPIYRYEVGFLLSGDYTVAFSCNAGSDTDADAENISFVGTTVVNIAPGEVEVLNFEAAPPVEEQAVDQL